MSTAGRGRFFSYQFPHLGICKPQNREELQQSEEDTQFSLGRSKTL
jgi:hypothetical protein